jgi:hypothetical protein
MITVCVRGRGGAITMTADTVSLVEKSDSASPAAGGGSGKSLFVTLARTATNPTPGIVAFPRKK